MTAAFVFDAMLCLLLVGTAVSAVAGRDLFASIAFFVTYGILIGLAWLRLGAIDVALAEVAIGAGATGRLPVDRPREPRRVGGLVVGEGLRDRPGSWWPGCPSSWS